MNKDTILKAGLGLALAAQVAIILGYVVTFAALIAGAVIAVALGDAFRAEAKVKLCDAHIYKHLENGTLLYCDAKQATHKDYQYLGTAKVNCDNVGRCSLA